MNMAVPRAGGVKSAVHTSDDEMQEDVFDEEESVIQSSTDDSGPASEDSEHSEGNDELEDTDSERESVSTEEEDDRLSLDENADDGGWMDVEDEANDTVSSSDDEEQPRRADEPADPKLHSNPGWADAMAKILRTNKPKGKKSIVLAKAKKLSQSSAEVKRKKENDDDPGFEIDGETKTDIKPKVEELDVKPDLDNISGKSKIKRRDHLAEGRVKPSVLDWERERALSKIATKGVVQLFNAVRQQQKDISSKLAEAGGSIRREEKVMKSIDKRAFLDVLMGDARSERVEDLVQTKKEEADTSSKTVPAASWNVLRDDFMTGGSLKNWDKAHEIKMENEDDKVHLD